MKKNIIFVMVFAFLSLVLFSASLYAEIPKTINFQGMLTDKDGVPLEGDYSITFSIYDVESGGTALWSESQTVSVSNGIYSCTLGSNTPLGLVFDEPYYLEITVAGETLSPRQTLSSSPYAFNSERLRGVNGEDFISKDANGNVGIGTENPQNRLHVVGADNSGATATLKITSPGQNMLIDGNEIDGDTGLYLNHNLKENVIIATGGGRVGIGTINPGAKLHAVGADNNGKTATLRITSPGQNMLIDGNEIDGDTGLYLNHNLNKNVILATGGGNVGIGTTNPGSYRLYVNGSLYCKGFTNAASSKELKKEITPLTEKDYELILAKLSDTDVVRYKMKDEAIDTDFHIGILAEYAPDEITTKDKKAINYSDYMGFLLAVLKAQQDEIAQLKCKIAAFENR